MVILRAMLALRRLSRAIALVAGLALIGGSTAGLACAWICGAGAASGAGGPVSAAAPGCHEHAATAAGAAFAPACCRPVASSADRLGPGPTMAWSMPLLSSSHRSVVVGALGLNSTGARIGRFGGPPGLARPLPLRI
jgi:hypothetical protein